MLQAKRRTATYERHLQPGLVPSQGLLVPGQGLLVPDQGLPLFLGQGLLIITFTYV